MPKSDSRGWSHTLRPSGAKDPRAATRAISVCLAGLWLLCAGGCPSKASQDSNQPPPAKSQPSSPPNHQPSTINQQPSGVTHYGYKVIRTYPHDPQAFTQGLVYEDGVLYEGTGLYGQSSLTKRGLESGNVLKRERLPRRYFGEGITIFRDKIFQLTWQSQTGFVYDKTTFRLLKEFKYPGEGWGLTHDGKQLIMSDGTATLRFLDPNTLAETRRVTVRDNGRDIVALNELEFIHGRVFANIWGTDSIVVIDPATGQVTGWLDLTYLWPLSDRPSEEFVLNGIAFLPKSNHLLITGKCWPKLYEIELTPKP